MRAASHRQYSRSTVQYRHAVQYMRRDNGQRKWERDIVANGACRVTMKHKQCTYTCKYFINSHNIFVQMHRCLSQCDLGATAQDVEGCIDRYDSKFAKNTFVIKLIHEEFCTCNNLYPRIIIWTRPWIKGVVKFALGFMCFVTGITSLRIATYGCETLVQ